jgi:transposase
MAHGALGTTWGTKGARPTVRVTFTRAGVNVISFISPRGRLWFRCFNGELTAQLFIEFLTALLHDVRGFIFLVIDKHPAHTAAATRRFIAERANRLPVHFLPSYAPDMNPDEHVWGYLKNMFRRTPLKLFAPTGVITFTWACTCSKMRVDEFSGGAAVVTAKGTTFMDAESWAAEQAADVRR